MIDMPCSPRQFDTPLPAGLVMHEYTCARPGTEEAFTVQATQLPAVPADPEARLDGMRAGAPPIMALGNERRSPLAHHHGREYDVVSSPEMLAGHGGMRTLVVDDWLVIVCALMEDSRYSKTDVRTFLDSLRLAP